VVALVALAAFACDAPPQNGRRTVVYAPDSSAMMRFERAFQREWAYDGYALQLTGAPFVPEYIQFSEGKVFIVNTKTRQSDSALYRVGMPADSSIMLPAPRMPRRTPALVVPFYLDILDPQDTTVAWYRGIAVTLGVPGDFRRAPLSGISWELAERGSRERPRKIDDTVQGTARQLARTNRKPADWIVPR
jgi:hypothetical protein